MRPRQLEFDFEPRSSDEIWEEGASAPSLLARLQDEMARHDYGHVRVTAKELRAVLGKISVVAVRQLRKPQRSRTT